MIGLIALLILAFVVVGYTRKINGKRGSHLGRNGQTGDPINERVNESTGIGRENCTERRSLLNVKEKVC